MAGPRAEAETQGSSSLAEDALETVDGVAVSRPGEEAVADSSSEDRGRQSVHKELEPRIVFVIGKFERGRILTHSTYSNSHNRGSRCW